jgi:transposase
MAYTKYLGAPLDNNNSERAIKLIIRRRKNSFFFKTITGAEVGNVIHSVIYTAARYDIDGLMEYLTAIFQNEEQVHQSPEKWMPWNYKISILEAKEISDLSKITG